MKKIRNISVFILYFILGIFLFSSTASAYIDPSAMTYIIQIVVGIIIASGAALGFYFKKIKRKFKKKHEEQEDYETQANVTLNESDEFDDSNLTEEEINSLYGKK